MAALLRNHKGKRLNSKDWIEKGGAVSYEDNKVRRVVAKLPDGQWRTCEATHVHHWMGLSPLPARFQVRGIWVRGFVFVDQDQQVVFKYNRY